MADWFDPTPLESAPPERDAVTTEDLRAANVDGADRWDHLHARQWLDFRHSLDVGRMPTLLIVTPGSPNLPEPCQPAPKAPTSTPHPADLPGDGAAAGGSSAAGDWASLPTAFI